MNNTVAYKSIVAVACATFAICAFLAVSASAQNPFGADRNANGAFDTQSTCTAMTYGHVLAECSSSCGETDRGCIHVCCHNGCNRMCKMGVPDYWDCHRQCEEWRDPGTPDMFSKPATTSP